MFTARTEQHFATAAVADFAAIGLRQGSDCAVQLYPGRVGGNECLAGNIVAAVFEKIGQKACWSQHSLLFGKRNSFAAAVTSDVVMAVFVTCHT